MYCKYCERDLDDSDFEIASIINGISYRRKKCKDCKQLMQRERRKRLAIWLREYKKSLLCKDCGNEDIRVLEFHHERDKEANISDMIRHGVSKEKIIIEIGKCTVLCANCHRIRHYNEL